MINNTGQIYCADTFFNASTAQWINSGTLSITGNIVNEQSTAMNGSAGTTVFLGTTNQRIRGGQPFITFNTTFNNNAGVTLLQSLQINGAGTFTNGIVTAMTTGFPLIFGATATLTGVADAAHVNGVVRSLASTGTFTYPVGSATLYRKVAANFTANASGLDCQYFAGDAGGAPFTSAGADPTLLVAYFKKEYWNIQPVSTATATVTIFYDQVVPAVITDISHLRVAHKRSTPAWVDEGRSAFTGNTSSGSVTSLAVNTWSPFTLGSINLLSPLPIILRSFDVTETNGNALLTWQTASEENSDHFEIENSTNGSVFAKIGNVSAAGNSSSIINYSYTDQNISRYNSSRIYYRLKLVDIDGNYKYSDIKLLELSNRSSIVKIFPIPFSNILTIELPVGWNGSTSINIIDMNGGIVYKREENISSAQTNLVLSDLSSLPSGSYVLTLVNDKNETRIKIVKE